MTTAPEAQERLPTAARAIIIGGGIIGCLTSGAYGNALCRAVGLGYITDSNGIDMAFVLAGRYEIEVAGERIRAQASLRPFYRSENIRGGG